MAAPDDVHVVFAQRLDIIVVIWPIPYRGEGADPQKTPKIERSPGAFLGIPLATPRACPLTVAMCSRGLSDVAMFLCDRNSMAAGPKYRQLAIEDQKAAVVTTQW
jgi:hypothetical protein